MDDPNLPLTEPTFFILLSLASGPLHGYAIMQEVAEMSAGRITLSTGTLYGALKRLMEQRWIERSDENEMDENRGRPRKSYALTDTGRRILNAETERLKRIARLASLRLTGSES